MFKSQSVQLTPSNAEAQHLSNASFPPRRHKPESAEELGTSETDEVKPKDAGESRTAYRLYLNEIGRTPLLSVEEEKRLARRIARGDENAREEMIKANLRLVVKIARDYEHMMPLLDLVAEGNIGLMKAVERFNPRKGAKFSTYAAWWIKQAIRRALSNQAKTIRLPVHIVDKLGKIGRASAALRAELGREPTAEEIAEHANMPVKNVSLCMRAQQPTVSIHSTIGGEQDGTAQGELIEDEKALKGDTQLDAKYVRATLEKALDSLDPREASIIKARFGLDGEERLTLEEIGEQFGLTRERIRQLQESALKKLSRLKAVKDCSPSMAGL